MCLNIITLRDGQEIACRKCWQCRETRIEDWVGRCIAESKTSKHTSSITLTYGRDEHGEENHARAKVLTYSDCQKYFKSLRRSGFEFSYFAVGEYGSIKGRAHWHILIFWRGDMPEHEKEKRFEEKHWPHGYSYFEDVSVSSIRYVCKYIQKDTGDIHSQGHLAMSKKPPLGNSYFSQLAQQHVDQGLSPQSPNYEFSISRSKATGRLTKFRMSGVTLSNFINSFIELWEKKHPKKWWPNSDMISEYLDSLALDDAEFTGVDYSVTLTTPPDASSFLGSPKTIKFSKTYKSHYVELEGFGRRYWAFNKKGVPSWEKNPKLVHVQRSGLSVPEEEVLELVRHFPAP